MLAKGKIKYIGKDTVDRYLATVQKESLLPKGIDRGVSIVYTPLNGTGVSCVTSLFKTVVNAASGRITGEILCMLPPLLLVTAIGSLLGFHLFRKMNMDTVKKAVNLLMIFIGLYYTFF